MPCCSASTSRAADPARDADAGLPSARGLAEPRRLERGSLHLPYEQARVSLPMRRVMSDPACAFNCLCEGRARILRRHCSRPWVAYAPEGVHIARASALRAVDAHLMKATTTCSSLRPSRRSAGRGRAARLVQNALRHHRRITARRPVGVIFSRFCIGSEGAWRAGVAADRAGSFTWRKVGASATPRHHQIPRIKFCRIRGDTYVLFFGPTNETRIY